jgi:hypothetical protein
MTSSSLPPFVLAHRRFRSKDTSTIPSDPHTVLMDVKNLTARTSDRHSTFVEFSMLLNGVYLSFLEALKARNSR